MRNAASWQPTLPYSFLQFWWRMHMAPPDKDKGGSAMPQHGANENGPADKAHPCDGGTGRGSTAVDQDHKACDEHTQGESF